MYNKLFGKILDSSIWLEDPYTRIVWITLLAAMDEDGYAHFSAIANLALRAQVPLERAEKAVDKLMAPDPESGDPDNDGRRIERVPGGFIILNATKYRDMATRIVSRERTRERVARHRAKKKDVTPCNDSVTQSYTYTHTETEKDIRQNSVGVSTRVPFQEIVKLYHETLPELPKVEVLTDARKGYIRQRWLNDLKTLDEWKHYFQHVRNSDFLMGKTSAKDRRPFRASLEWLTRPANFAKVAEDFYHG